MNSKDKLNNILKNNFIEKKDKTVLTEKDNKDFHLKIALPIFKQIESNFDNFKGFQFSYVTSKYITRMTIWFDDIKLQIKLDTNNDFLSGNEIGRLRAEIEYPGKEFNTKYGSEYGKLKFTYQNIQEENFNEKIFSGFNHYFEQVLSFKKMKFKDNITFKASLLNSNIEYIDNL